MKWKNSMDQPKTVQPSFRWATQLAGGCLIFLFLMFFVAAIFVFWPSQSVRNLNPTPTTAVTQVPQILVRQPVDKGSVIREDFSSNKREWSLYYPNGKLEIINGNLILQSNAEQNFVIGRSQELDFLEQPYYIQADFSTDVDNGYAYGLIFGISDTMETYYMFEVAPKTGYFRLLKYNTGKWDELVSFTQSVVKPFPEANTLSVYFDAGEIELYINGGLVSGFTDSNYYRSTGVGVFTSNTGYRLIVDNFFAYGGK
jgi:hypothetical protein